MNIFDRFQKWWYFNFRNPVIRSGEKGGFKWVFRRFWVEFSTVSGNWKARFTAPEHPYAYLLAGKNDDNIYGFCVTVYEVGMLLTTEQKFTNDVQKALKKYSERIEKAVVVEEDEIEEQSALEFEKEVQEFNELPKKERKKAEKDIDKRFKKAVKETKNEK